MSTTHHDVPYDVTEAELRVLSKQAMRSYLRYWCDAFRLPGWSRERIVESITVIDDHHLADEVRDPAKRVYGPRSWKRADGTVASSWDDRGKAIDSPVCDASVLGVVSIGPEYGTAFPVCLARDTCTVPSSAPV